MLTEIELSKMNPAPYNPRITLTEDMPEWVGFLHGPDEGFSLNQFKVALKLYILTLMELDKLDF